MWVHPVFGASQPVWGHLVFWAAAPDDKAKGTKLLEKNHAEIVATIKVLTKQTYTAHLTS